MISEGRHRLYAWGISAVIHILLFVVVALTGLFVRVSAEPDKVVDVALYEVEQAAAAGGTAGEAGAAPVADDIAYSVSTAAPEISEIYTKQPETQQSYKEQKQRESAAREKMSAAKAESGSGNKSTGTAATGSAAGGGNTAGNGQGQGDGQGTGEKDNAAAQRPATPPRLLAGANPAYPDDLRRQGVEGAVRLRVVVGRDGSVESASVTSSSGYASMDEEAVAAAYRYQFSPALNVYEEPVRCAVSQSVQFRLR